MTYPCLLLASEPAPQAKCQKCRRHRDWVHRFVELSRCAAKCEEGFRAGWKEEGEVHEGI